MLPDLENCDDGETSTHRNSSTRSCPTSLQSTISRRASNTRRSLKEFGESFGQKGRCNMKRIDEDAIGDSMCSTEEPVPPPRPHRLRRLSCSGFGHLDSTSGSNVVPARPENEVVGSPNSDGARSNWSESVEKFTDAIHRNYYKIAYTLVIVAYVVGFAEYLYFRLVSVLIPERTIFHPPCQEKSDQQVGKDGFHYGVSILAFIAIAIFQLMCFFGLTISEKWTICKDDPRNNREAAQRHEFAAFVRNLVAKTMYRVFLCYGICSVINWVIIFYMVAIQDSLGDTVSTVFLYMFDGVVILYFLAFPITTVIYHPHIHCLGRRGTAPASFSLPPPDPKTQTSTLASDIVPQLIFSRDDPRRKRVDRRADVVASPELEEYLQSPRRQPAARVSTIV